MEKSSGSPHYLAAIEVVVAVAVGHPRRGSNG